MTTPTDIEHAQITLTPDELHDLVYYLRLTADIPMLDVPPVVAGLLEMTEQL